MQPSPCAVPFETFVEIGLDLNGRSPFSMTMVIGIANGYNGYLPTPQQHQFGGYQTWLGTNKVREDASVIITDHLLEMLAFLAKEQSKPDLVNGVICVEFAACKALISNAKMIERIGSIGRLG